jgi:hypothetical protein
MSSPITILILAVIAYIPKNVTHHLINHQINSSDTTKRCRFNKPDTSVFKIHLLDSKSSIRVIGEKYALIEDDVELPHVDFNSSNNQQVLTLYFHYGGVKNEFAEFQVAENTEHLKNKTLNISEFKTGNKIELGISKTQLIKILGNCFETRKSNDKEILKYKIDDFKNSDFLKSYNYPIYYADYEFAKNRLIRFRFGFQYP